MTDSDSGDCDTDYAQTLPTNEERQQADNSSSPIPTVQPQNLPFETKQKQEGPRGQMIKTEDTTKPSSLMVTGSKGPNVDRCGSYEKDDDDGMLADWGFLLEANQPGKKERFQWTLPDVSILDLDDSHNMDDIGEDDNNDDFKNCPGALTGEPRTPSTPGKAVRAAVKAMVRHTLQYPHSPILRRHYWSSHGSTASTGTPQRRSAPTHERSCRNNHNSNNSAGQLPISLSNSWREGCNTVTVVVEAIDDDPGAVQSGHYLWPAASILSEYLVKHESLIYAQQQQQQQQQQHDHLYRIQWQLLYPPVISVLELGAGNAMASLAALQVWQPTLQCVVVTDHDPGTLERARNNHESTLEALMDDASSSEQTTEDTINAVASIPVFFECLEWFERPLSTTAVPVSEQNQVQHLNDDESRNTASQQEKDERNAPVNSDATTESQHWDSNEGIIKSKMMSNMMKKCAQQEFQWIHIQQECLAPHTTNSRTTIPQSAFDVVLGSDLIYCHNVVRPLLYTAATCMQRPRGRFLLSQSFAYDEETEQAIDATCSELGLVRCILVEHNPNHPGQGRIQEFRFAAGLVGPPPLPLPPPSPPLLPESLSDNGNNSTPPPSNLFPSWRQDEDLFSHPLPELPNLSTLVDQIPMKEESSDQPEPTNPHHQISSQQ